VSIGASRPEEVRVTYVERVARLLDGPRPRYPDMLRAAGVEGEVVVRFVVDTAGRAEPATVTILRSPHELFAASVESALPKYRFAPAMIGNTKVPQAVQMPFVFGLR
jgi:periplasmic protein TonB